MAPALSRGAWAEARKDRLGRESQQIGRYSKVLERPFCHERGESRTVGEELPSKVLVGTPMLMPGDRARDVTDISTLQYRLQENIEVLCAEGHRTWSEPLVEAEPFGETGEPQRRIATPPKYSRGIGVENRARGINVSLE